MKEFHWFEAKQLDRVTNYSTETECIQNFINSGVPAYYYCSFSKKKIYYGLSNNIRYLGISKNKYIKYIEFRILVIIQSSLLTISSSDNVIMVNQELVKCMKPALILNKILKKNNKFILDVRTFPTAPVTFEKDMEKYNKQLSIAVSKFDGISFITPFMAKISLQPYPIHPPTTTWSSGVNMNLFNAEKYDYSRDTNKFRIFYHGGISISRGNLDLIKACEKVVEYGFDIELIQIGKIVDKELKTYIDKKNIGKWCKLYDAKPLNDIPSLVAKCDLPVLPFPNFMAWRVSSPIKLMEYLAMGKPVLAPNMECFTDILSTDSGMITYYDINEQNTIEAITHAIINIVKDFKIQQNFIKYTKAIEFATKHFTWQVQVKNLIDFCKNI